MSIEIEQDYFALLPKIAEVDWQDRARLVGGLYSALGIEVPFFGQMHMIGPHGCFSSQGQPVTAAVGLVLCRYILNFPTPLPATGDRISFRELTDSGPLVNSFASNTNKIITSTFGHSPDDLLKNAGKFGASNNTHQDGYDMILRFKALPHIALFLQFNAADADFPAQSGLLFHQSAEMFLDIKSLFILGTYLTGRLITGK